MNYKRVSWLTTGKFILTEKKRKNTRQDETVPILVTLYYSMYDLAKQVRLRNLLKDHIKEHFSR